MAIYVFKMKTFSRSAGSRGSRATSAAAYRAGERIRDERTDAVYDHRRRQDVLHKEIILPAKLAGRGSAPDWARTRSALWNAAEWAETRRNARVAREFMLVLPHELAPAARLQLAQGFAHELSDRYGTGIDLVLHAPRGDPRNFHAHLLSTTREVTPEGLGRKAALELSGTERHRRGLARWSQEKTWLRERWAEHTNQALRQAHLEVRVSHLRAATPDLTRSPWLPIAAYYMEKQGRHSFLAERIRARHQALVACAGLTSAPPAPDLPPARAPVLARAGPVGAQATAGARSWVERVRERARTAWLALREQQLDRSSAARPSQPAIQGTRAQQRLHSPPTHSSPSYLQEPHDVARESVRNWLAYRQSHPELNTDMARQALSNWLAYRQRQLEQGMERERSPGPHREQAERVLSGTDEQQRNRGHDFDLSL